MTKMDKLIKRVLSKPRDLKWEELVKFLAHFGYEEENGGKTSGSVRNFVNQANDLISIHKPHPENTVLPYVINKVLKKLNLKKEGD